MVPAYTMAEKCFDEFETQIKTAVKRCFFAVEPGIVYTARQLLLVTNSDVPPAFHHSDVSTNSCATVTVGT